MIIQELSVAGFLSWKHVGHVFDNQPKFYSIPGHSSTDKINFMHAICYVLDPCYHNIPLTMVQSTDTATIEGNEPSAESFVSLRIILEESELEHMTDGTENNYELDAEIIATRYLDQERYQFVYINQVPKQLATFHHLLYGTSVYSNNFFDLQNNVILNIHDRFFRDRAFVCPDILKHTQAVETALQQEADSMIRFIELTSQDLLKQLTNGPSFHELKLGVAKRVLDNTSALYLAHQKHVSSLQEMIDTTDQVLHKYVIQRDSTYDDDRHKWLMLKDKYFFQAEDIFDMQLDELLRLLICTTYQISQETEPLVRAGRMAELIVIENEKENAEAFVEKATRKSSDVCERKKQILLQYSKAKNENHRLHRSYLVTLKKLDSHNQSMFALMKNRFHAELKLTAAIHDVTSIYSSQTANQIFTQDEIVGNICFEEILTHPDTPTAIVLNYRGLGSDFVQLKHEYKELMSLFQYVLKDILKRHMFRDEQHKTDMQTLLEGKSNGTCSFIVERNNEERQRLSNLKSHSRPSYLKSITAYLEPVHNSTIKALLKEFLVLNISDPSKHIDVPDLVRIHQRTVICIRTGRVYHNSGKCQQFICDFYTKLDYWLGNQENLKQARRKTRVCSDSMRVLNADMLNSERCHKTLTTALQDIEKEFESQRKEIHNMQIQIDELDLMEFQQRKILLKWQKNVTEINMKLNYYEEIKNALVNGFPSESEMQAKSEEATINQMLSLSLVAAEMNKLKNITDSLNDIKRCSMHINYQPYWKPPALLEAINSYRNSRRLCLGTAIDQLVEMYKLTFNQKHLQSIISYQQAKDRFEEYKNNSKSIEESKILMAKTAEYCEKLRFATRIDKILVEQLNKAHLNSLDKIMKAINWLIPLLSDNTKQRVLLVLLMKDGRRYTHDHITAMDGTQLSAIVNFKFELFDDMELVVHENKFDKYIELAYYLATCVIGPTRPVILLVDLMKFDVNEQRRIQAVLHEQPFFHHQIFCAKHEPVRIVSPSP